MGEKKRTHDMLQAEPTAAGEHEFAQKVLLIEPPRTRASASEDDGNDDELLGGAAAARPGELPACGHDSEDNDVADANKFFHGGGGAITIRRGRGRPRKGSLGGGESPAPASPQLPPSDDPLAAAAFEPDMITRLLQHEDDKKDVLKRTGFSNNYIMKLQRKVLHATEELQLAPPETVTVGGSLIHVLFQEDGTSLFIKKELCELLNMKGTTFSYWKKKVGVDEIDTSSDFRLMDRCRGIFGGRSTYTLYTGPACQKILALMLSSRQRVPLDHLAELSAVVDSFVARGPNPASAAHPPHAAPHAHHRKRRRRDGDAPDDDGMDDEEAEDEGGADDAYARRGARPRRHGSSTDSVSSSDDEDAPRRRAGEDGRAWRPGEPLPPPLPPGAAGASPPPPLAALPPLKADTSPIITAKAPRFQMPPLQLAISFDVSRVQAPTIAAMEPKIH